MTIASLPLFLVHDSRTEVPAGGTAQICVAPKTGPVKPWHLRIDPVVALHFQIDDIRVGCRSQFPIAQSIPCSHFMMGPGLPASQLPYLSVYEAALAYARTTRIGEDDLERALAVERAGLALRRAAEQAERMIAETAADPGEPHGRDFQCETVFTAMDFRMIVTNVTRHPCRFVATWECKAPDYEAERRELVHRGNNIMSAWQDLTRHIARPVGAPPHEAPILESLDRGITDTPERKREIDRVGKEPPGFGWDPHGND